jgi:hypothetical protein
MAHDRSAGLSKWRGLALVCIASLGLLSIVGSGGGDRLCLLPPCPGDFPLEPALPSIEPAAQAVQVGSTATFSVRTADISSPTYQWSRTPRGGTPAAIGGATGATYSVVGANLADDGAQYTVAVAGIFDGRTVALSSPPARLAVSSMPAVLLEDKEFEPANWSVAAQSTPATSGPTHSVTQETSGGNPGAHRQTRITLPAGPARLYLFQTYLGGSYEPAVQGPVYLIEFTQECRALAGSLGPGPQVLLEQAGRRYTAGAPTQCEATAWSSKVLLPGVFAAGDFTVVDGPVCGVGESCPDFSATGAPLRLGFGNLNQSLSGSAGASGGFGIDNWKVKVWRR